jgi:hypothetical protein
MPLTLGIHKQDGDLGWDWLGGQARTGSGDLRSRAVSIGLSWGSNHNNQPLLVLHGFLGSTMSTRILVLFSLPLNRGQNENPPTIEQIKGLRLD